MKFATTQIVKLVSSNKFFWFILLLIILHGCWYALNFSPSILDEGRHFGAVQYFAQEWNPFKHVQSEQWDHLGVLTRDVSYAYYYFVSFFLKCISLISDSIMQQVIFLRFIHTGLFVAAIWVYRKIFDLLQVSRHLSHLVLLFLVLTPSIAILGGVITYDTPVFLLSGLILLQAVKIVNSNKSTKNQFLALFAYSLLVILIKYSALVLIVPILLYILFDMFQNKKYPLPAKSIDKAGFLLVLVVLLLLGLIIERHVVNQLQYGGINANCVELLSEERCLKNYTQERSILAAQNKPLDFKPKSHFNYFVQDWAPNMVRSQVRLNPWDAPVRVLHAAYFGAVILGTLLVALCFRRFWNQKDYRMLLITTAFFSLALFIKLYNSYASLGQVVATSSRYLLPVQPLFMMFVIVAADRVLNGYEYIKLAGLIILLLIFTQGGGVLTYRMHAPLNLRWSEATQ